MHMRGNGEVRNAVNEKVVHAMRMCNKSEKVVNARMRMRNKNLKCVIRSHRTL